MTFPDYNFAGRFFEARPGIRMHYLDEGQGEPMVMVHGNPTWSFYYRHLVNQFRDRFRCLVPDHIGCGLSDKPGLERYDYSFSDRVADLSRWLDQLNLRQPITLVVHDWGGMIGMTWAVRNPERIRRLVILNTAAFHLPATTRLPRSLWWGRNTSLGALLIRGGNAFCRGAARWCVTRKPLPADVRAAYLAPYDSWAHRLAVLKFVQTIPLQTADRDYQIITETQDRLEALSGKPMLIAWGARDFVFDDHFLAEWQRRFPRAEVHRYADAGHYVLEDAREEISGSLEKFLSEPSASGSPARR